MGRQSWADFFRHTEATYGVTALMYRVLYRAQGGRCYVCRKATGKSRRLGVDHDHLTGEVRGLVCTGSLSANTCNRLIAIYSRDQLLRAVAMLSDPPPARAVLRALRGPGLIPSLIEGMEPFDVRDVKGVDLDDRRLA
ncbi:MAG: endonuclease domain-containing protein [Labedaea sp.]